MYIEIYLIKNGLLIGSVSKIEDVKKYLEMKKLIIEDVYLKLREWEQ